MPEQLSVQIKTLVEQANDFVTTELTALNDDLIKGKIDRQLAHTEVVRASKKAGFFGLTQPRLFGGMEASNLTLTALRDTFSAHNNSLTRFVFGPGAGVLGSCDEPLKSRYLEPLLKGEKLGAFAFTEPDDAEYPTHATVETDTLIISGTKSYVTGGGNADFLNTLVEVEELGPALVVIDRQTPGVTLKRQFETLDGSHHAEFEFKKARVPRTNIIGKPGDGLPQAMRQIGDVRLGMAAEAVGTMRWIINFLDLHLNAPHRSGKPLAAREGVRLRYSDLRIKAFAARSMTYRTARLADAGENVVNEGIASKVFATECLGQITDEALQLCGGNALTIGHPLEKLYRQVRASRFAEGASDVLRLNLARGALELNKGRI